MGEARFLTQIDESGCRKLVSKAKIITSRARVWLAVANIERLLSQHPDVHSTLKSALAELLSAAEKYDEVMLEHVARPPSLESARSEWAHSHSCAAKR